MPIIFGKHTKIAYKNLSVCPQCPLFVNPDNYRPLFAFPLPKLSISPFMVNGTYRILHYNLEWFLTSLAKRQKHNLKAKDAVERANGNLEKHVLDELDAAHQKQVALTALLWNDDIENVPEETLREHLTNNYFDSIQPQILALTTFHSRTILAQKVFGKMTTESIVSLVDWMRSKPDKQETLRSLARSFDNAYWKQRLRPIRRSCYLFEQIYDSENVDIFEFTSQILRHRNLREGKSVKCITWKIPKVYDEMIGHRTILFTVQGPENHYLARGISDARSEILIGDIQTNSKWSDAQPDISEPYTTGYRIGENVQLFEPFLIQISSTDQE